MAAQQEQPNPGLQTVPTLARDDRYTWAKAADLALRHIARVPEFVRHPDDTFVERGVPQSPLPTSTVAREQPLVNLDAHVPWLVRVPKTAPYVKALIDNVHFTLTRAPSDYLPAYSDLWVCPNHPCGFTVDLSALSNVDVIELRKATNGQYLPTFTEYSDGGVVALVSSRREVVDIIGLRHYEEAHLHQLGIRHVIHGQRDDGRILFYWVPVDILSLLTENSVRGSVARHYEEKCRANTQRAMAFTARVWAADILQGIREDEHDARQQSRRSQSDFAQTEFGRLTNLNVDRVDSLFEPHAALLLGRGPKSAAVREPMRAMERLHERFYDVGAGGGSVAPDRDRLRAAAQEQQVFWSTGEGSERMKKTATTPATYAVTLPRARVD
ncbi:unnamed protein product [Peniophora sp. CBMAI 1063]|nr:unnamed protein product [Peniophora sp. CBMAI 1063]